MSSVLRGNLQGNEMSLENNLMTDEGANKIDLLFAVNPFYHVRPCCTAIGWQP